MFFYLSKLLTIFIDPLFLFLFVLFFLILKIKQNRLIRGLLLTAWFVFSIFSTNFIANGLLDKLERAVAPVKLEQSYEGVVVLSGMLHLNISNKSQLEFSGAADRILKGIELVKNGVAKKLLISGGTGSLTNPSKSEATLLAEFAIRQGVPKDKIIVEANSRNTYENAVETEKLVRSHDLKSLILVTSAFHMYRSLGCFSEVGLEVTPLSVDNQAGLDKNDFRNFLPSSHGLATFNNALHEIVGILSYGLSGKANYTNL